MFGALIFSEDGSDVGTVYNPAGGVYSDILRNIFGGGGSVNSGGSGSSGTNTPPDSAGSDDVITTTTTAARTISSAELLARIKAAGGKLDVDRNSSDYIVAADNPLRFSTIQLANGQYRITGNYNLYYLAGGSALLLLLLVASSSK